MGVGDIRLAADESFTVVNARPCVLRGVNTYITTLDLEQTGRIAPGN